VGADRRCLGQHPVKRSGMSVNVVKDR
jgi:hypothetical protein